MQLTQLNHTIDTWINALDGYDYNMLLEKFDAENWSLGQVYHHLLQETGCYIGFIDCCLSSDENAAVEMTADAKIIFANNSLPDIRIKRGDELLQSVPQPISKADLRQKMQQLKMELNERGAKVLVTDRTGKVRHPGLGYFNAAQWLQFAEIHLRHHLKQKQRIEAALKQNAQ